ncbi:spherulation-specific family 4 protein [Actinoplanes sp. NPDC049802]|uniref:spherulation-specific family 4 protein n=1 Tax=Actinoplanes sp. NPDC049802 TaxID=3154742 RepID=UPI0033E769C7
MGPVVPAYFHPAPHAAEWRRLADAGPAVRAVVLNAADGPGTRPDPELRLAATRLRVPVLGYVDTAYGARDIPAVERDIARHLTWYPVGGVFFDQVAAGPEWLAHYGRLAAAARRHGCGTVMFHHGVYPDPRFAGLADMLGVFEGPARRYLTLVPPGWARRHTAATFCHLVYDTPAHLLPTVLEHAAGVHAASVYLTDRGGANPWDGLPPYFPRPC